MGQALAIGDIAVNRNDRNPLCDRFIDSPSNIIIVPADNHYSRYSPVYGVIDGLHIWLLRCIFRTGNRQFDAIVHGQLPQNRVGMTYKNGMMRKFRDPDVFFHTFLHIDGDSCEGY